MKVILLQDVPKIGKKYQVKNVSDGYAQNFLFPKKLAEIATPQAIKTIEKKQKAVEQEKQTKDNILNQNLNKLKNLKVSIQEKANEKGHLFATIKAEEIQKILKEKHQIDIPLTLIKIEKPIKEVGEHKIKAGKVEFILNVTEV